MQILFHKNFDKKYRKLNSKIQNSVDKRIKLFISDKFNLTLNNHPLSGKYSNFWSINITGDYRAVYYFLEVDSVIFVEMGTHSELYK